MFYYATLVTAAVLFFGCPASPVPPVADSTDDAGPTDTGPAEVDAAPEASPAPPSTLDFEVTESGPYPVGYRTWDVTYTPPGADEPRTIGVHVWYPAGAAQGEPPRYAGLFLDEEAFTDAPLAPPVDGSNYPVWVHSHGHQAYAGNSSALMRYVATHGWVAVAPDHVGDMLADSSTSETLAHYRQRPQDITAALDAVEADPQWMLADTTRVVMSGHSRGVYTVWASSGATYDSAAIDANWPDAPPEERQAFSGGFKDPRIVASVGLAGGYRSSWFGDQGYAAVAIPMLTMSGSEDNPEGFQAQWENLTEISMVWVEIAGACHQAFALGTCSTISAEEGFGLVNAYSLAFGRRHLLGDSAMDALLDGSETISEKATVQTR